MAPRLNGTTPKKKRLQFIHLSQHLASQYHGIIFHISKLVVSLQNQKNKNKKQWRYRFKPCPLLKARKYFRNDIYSGKG